MHTKRFLTGALCLMALASSCEHPREVLLEEEAAIAFSVTAAPGDTKSAYYDDAALSRIKSVVIYGADRSGNWKRAVLASPDGKTASGSFRFPLGEKVTFYALANMGDATLPLHPDGTLAPEDFTYRIPPDANLLESGFPMAGSDSCTVEKESAPLTISLKRLFAKVDVTIEKGGLTGGSATVLLSHHLHLRNANRRLRPFHEEESRALSASDLFDAPFDSHIFTSADEKDLRHERISLYVPENTSPELATYIEYEGEKDGRVDGVDGTLVYRGLLGPVRRNGHYSATLSLTWDGLMWRADGWRIDTGAVSDGRVLVLSAQKESFQEVPSLGKIQRNSAKDLYVSFSRNDGTSWVHGAKDIDNWPYGWDFFIDGVKQAGGPRGLADGAIGWIYSGDTAGDRLTVSPGAGATVRSRHTLQVISADGKVASNIVSFDVSAPLGLQWDASAPTFVAQRGKLVATALDKPSAPVTYTVTSGGERVRLASAGNLQSMMVNLLGAGEVTVLASCDATGQDEEITFQVKAPELTLEADTYYAGPDGSQAMSEPDGVSGFFIGLSYTLNGRPPLLRQASATATVLGNRLDQALYDEVLRMVPSTDTPVLEAVNPVDDSYLEVYAKSLSQYPKTGGSVIGTVTVSAASAQSGVVPAVAVIRSVDPFTGYPGSVSLTTTKDIEDFSATGILGSYTQNKFSVTLPSAPVSKNWFGISARFTGESAVNDELSGLFTVTGSTVSWNAIAQNLTRYKAGTFQLCAYVENQHSHERWYSNPFYRGRLFVHGAVCGRGVDAGSKPRQEMAVYTDYYGDIEAYRADGLGAAWPDVRTTHTERSYEIEWAWHHDGMRKHFGECEVRGVNNIRVRNRNAFLFSVFDVCYTEHEGNPIWHGCYFTGPNTDGAARMEFVTRPTDSRDPSYNKYHNNIVKYINPELVFIHPSESETHTYNGISGCGYYVMHISSEIADRFM